MKQHVFNEYLINKNMSVEKGEGIKSQFNKT